MKFLCVKVGQKYSSQTVNLLLDRLSSNYSGTVDLYCLTDDELGLSDSITPIYIESSDKWKKLQWHKTSFFRKCYNGFENGEEVIVCDIDIDIIQNIDDIVNFPFNKFAAARRWWMLEHGQMSGTLYKFRIGELNFIDSLFDEDWQEYWVENEMVSPPVNGEQNYVEQAITDWANFKIDYFPDGWFTKWTNSKERNGLILQDYHELTNELIFDGFDFHDDVKIVHYAGYGK